MTTEKTKKYRAINIKFLGATHCKPSRIKFTDELFRQSKIMPLRFTYDGKIEKGLDNIVIGSGLHLNCDSIIDQALDYLTNNGFNIIGYSELKNGYVIFCDNWGSDCVELNNLNKKG